MNPRSISGDTAGFNNPREAWKTTINDIVLNEIYLAVMPDDDGEHEEAWRDPKVLAVFHQAFIHKSVAPNEKDNYERLEFIGDRQLKISFAEYITQRFPDITVSESSELDSGVMSKARQSTLSKTINLPAMLWAADDSVGQDVDVQEDLFESLFGAVATVGNNFFGGNGASFSFNLLAQIFATEEIDFSLSMGNAITRVKEFLEILPGGHQTTLESLETAFRIGETNRWRYTLRLPPTVISTMAGSIKSRMERAWSILGNPLNQIPERIHIEEFLRVNPELVNDPLVTLIQEHREQLSRLEARGGGITVVGEGELKDEARNEAYTRMLKEINSIINSAKLLQYARGIKIHDPLIRDRIEVIMNKMRLDTIQPRFHGDHFDFYQLIGVELQAGQLPLYKILLTYPRPNREINHDEAVTAMLREFAGVS